ncbi:hypothetical protein BS78_08G137700 [Paspalum vaginatum]|nr:hypothetical protein BS78_08G137700 [Paspalum vaginatum]
MGKAGRWLRGFFLAGRKGRRAKDRDCQSAVSAPLHAQPATPSGRERRRWSFRRAAKADAGAGTGQGPLGGSSSSHCFSEAEVRAVLAQDRRAVAEAATVCAGTVAAPAPGPGEEAAAAVRIQSAFRAYLARKALCALRGMVKLQAMVRGQLVRRQAAVTLRRMQALVDAQSRALAERLRLRLLEDAAAATPRAAPSRRSPQHPRPRKQLDQDAAEDVKTVVVDDGGGEQRVAGRRSSYHATTPSRTPAAAELYQKVSPTPSALTDGSARTLSGRLDDASFASVSNAPSRRKAAWRADRAPPPQAALLPSYMANTESSRAKARSQSAPRQRLSSASETEAAASPSPSCCERPPCGGGARRRASLDPMDLPGAPRSAAGRVERGPSRARLGAISSLPGSECGSSSTAGHRGSARGAWHG